MKNICHCQKKQIIHYQQSLGIIYEVCPSEGSVGNTVGAIEGKEYIYRLKYIYIIVTGCFCGRKLKGCSMQNNTIWSGFKSIEMFKFDIRT